VVEVTEGFHHRVSGVSGGRKRLGGGVELSEVRLDGLEFHDGQLVDDHVEPVSTVE
jgi:hypothetical protein